MNAIASKPKILIIEDDKYLVELLSFSFKKSGIDFEIVIDGESGLAKLQEFKPDLILLDLVLPGMSGFEFLEKVKSDKNLATIPVLILSNLGQEEEVRRGLSSGAEDFMIKAHYDIPQIIQKIMEYLKKIKH